MQLPEEAKKFDKINKEFKTIMKTTHESPVVVRAATQKEFDALTAMGDRLDKCQKSLTDYLDTKRNAFSRFYFISDDELLSVLGSSDPTSIQVHMLKLFDNVKELKFGSGASKIQGMVSSEKEGFDLCVKDITPPEKGASPVDGPVEEWMTLVEQAMKDSLKVISKTGIFNYASSPRSEWILDADVLGMVTLAGQCSASSTVPSRRRRDSCPSHDDVDGLFFEFEAVRTVSRDRNAPRRSTLIRNARPRRTRRRR